MYYMYIESLISIKQRDYIKQVVLLENYSLTLTFIYFRRAVTSPVSCLETMKKRFSQQHLDEQLGIGVPKKCYSKGHI